jgi:hypothetical protein
MGPKPRGIIFTHFDRNGEELKTFRIPEDETHG